MKLKSLGTKAACLTVGVALMSANLGFATTGSANSKLGRATVVATVNSKNLGLAKAPTTTPAVIAVAGAVAAVSAAVAAVAGAVVATVEAVKATEGFATQQQMSNEAALSTLD